jgi:hypothetical protein
MLHCLDSRLKDGAKVLSIGRALLPRNMIFFTVSGTHLCSRLSNPQGLARLEGLSKLKDSRHWVSNPRPSGL